MKRRVLILGYGEMGHAMEYLLAEKQPLRIWHRAHQNNLEEEVVGAQVILFCVPVNAHAEIIQRIAPYLATGSLCLSIAKGLDESGRTAAQTLGDMLHPHRYGIMCGPMIAEEIVQGRYAFADVALSHAQDFDMVRALFQGSTLICKQATDMLGSSWLGVLKNVYAILYGIAEALKLGDNMRGHLMVTATAEISAITQSLGADTQTVYSDAGLGDLLTTASSEHSHHQQLGRRLALGEVFELTGEGVHTLKMIEKFQLFDSRSYPLFTLATRIIAQPEQLQIRLQEYLNHLKMGEFARPTSNTHL